MELLKPYQGPSHPGENTQTLNGKIMSGYQGWFRTPGDGWNNRWVHWSHDNEFRPGHCKIDVWPDMSEMDDDEKMATPFKHKDGSPAHVFSSVNRKTALRHFKWMQDYGLAGVYVQRFFGSAKDSLDGKDSSSLQVLSLCREGANLHGRTYCVMYDLSGMKEGQQGVIIEDWKRLFDAMAITKDPAYQHHKGKPVVAVWGIGFMDRPDYGLESCAEIVKFLKEDPHYGGNTLMLGVPTGWREQQQEPRYAPFVKRAAPVLYGDCLKDPRLHEIIRSADIVSPWSVDRITDPSGAVALAEGVWKGDLAWCKQAGLDFLPVAFPGFSWKNMFPSEPFNQIPRLKGKFLWQMYHEAVKLGVSMIYQAMFDEVDEGTAIFKCSDNPPMGESRFVDMEGMPEDQYLWLAGQAQKMLRQEIPLSQELPQRK